MSRLTQFFDYIKHRIKPNKDEIKNIYTSLTITENIDIHRKKINKRRKNGIR
mgnify:CR=1 FL=1